MVSSFAPPLVKQPFFISIAYFSALPKAKETPTLRKTPKKEAYHV
jgi:hypothetical protein